jgi:hypothetical protein
VILIKRYVRLKGENFIAVATENSPVSTRWLINRTFGHCSRQYITSVKPCRFRDTFIMSPRAISRDIPITYTRMLKRSGRYFDRLKLK